MRQDQRQMYLKSSQYFDFDHDAVVQFAQGVVQPHMSEVEKAVALYLAVRDGLKYNPYVFDVKPVAFSASHCARQSQSYCVPKAILLVALARLHGIPARLGLADVKNHISSQALIEWLQSDLFVMHGYSELYLEGKWVKATPAFDAALCAKMGINPLEFNGKDDSIFHEYTQDGSRHMEYVNDHGQHQDVPYELILSTVSAAYPHLSERFAKDAAPLAGRSLEQEV